MACATLMPWMPPWGETLSGMLWIDCRSDASVRRSEMSDEAAVAHALWIMSA